MVAAGQSLLKSEKERKKLNPGDSYNLPSTDSRRNVYKRAPSPTQTTVSRGKVSDTSPLETRG